MKNSVPFIPSDLLRTGKNIRLWICSRHFLRLIRTPVPSESKCLFIGALVLNWWSFVVFLPREELSWQERCRNKPECCWPIDSHRTVRVQTFINNWSADQWCVSSPVRPQVLFCISHLQLWERDTSFEKPKSHKKWACAKTRCFVLNSFEQCCVNPV